MQALPVSRQLQNRESKTGPGDRSRYPRRTSAFREWRRIQDRENGAERRDLCDQQEFGAGDETGWLWMQSLTNQSPGANSLITGKIQGTFFRNRDHLEILQGPTRVQSQALTRKIPYLMEQGIFRDEQGN